MLTKTFFSLMREKTKTNPRRAQCVRQRCTTSMTWTNQTTRGKYPCMSSGDQQSFIRGDFAQLALFDRKGTPPAYLLLPTNGTRFTYVTREDSWPSLELCIPLNCCKCTVFAMNKSQNQNVLATFSRVVKCICLSFFSLFTDRSNRFPYPYTSIYILQLKKWSPFHIPEA